MKTKLKFASLASVTALGVLSLATPQVVLANPDGSANATASIASVAQAKTPAQAKKGSMIYSDGKRIGQVFRVRDNGDAQIVINGKSHLVPASSLIEEDGKLTTTLSRAEVVSTKG